MKLRLFLLLFLALLNLSWAAERSPNIVLIFVDDLGYADIGAFGDCDYPTPHLDRMAREGRRFTDFMVSAPVCSASRAALMTGCLHARVGIRGAFNPKSKNGLNPEEVTLAELCQEKGYATAAYGKWHLGHHPKFLPTRQGFDEYHGIPYSNDMWLWHPRYHGLANDDPARRKTYRELPLLENEKVIDADVTAEEQRYLTQMATERALSFIERNKDRPFFLYLPYSMVHVPIFASPEFEGKSGAGLFGDVMMELDDSVGQVVAKLEALGLDEDTLVIFTSDNGPWTSYGTHAGSPGPFREAKGTSFDGGVRVPTLFYWPGKIPAGTTCEALSGTIDILPTVARLIGAELPERKIDGFDISSLIFGDGSQQTPHEFFPHYYKGELQGIRNQNWRLVFPHNYRSLNGREGRSDGLPIAYDTNTAELTLYDRRNDLGESTNVIEKYPEIYDTLARAAARYREELGDRLHKKEGFGVRPSGVLTKGEDLLEW